MYIYTYTYAYIFIYMYWNTWNDIFSHFTHLIYKTQARNCVEIRIQQLWFSHTETQKHGMKSWLTGFYNTHFADKLVF